MVKSKETKEMETPEEIKEASEETKPTSAEAKEKPAETEDKPAETKEKAAEAKEKPAKTKEKAAEAKEKAAEAKEKALDKMTVKELREMAKEIPGLAGVHAMKKDELIVELKKAKGIKEEPVKKADTGIADLKKKIKALKAERQAALEAKDRKMATIYKRRISRLKKKTRRAAA